MILQNGKHWMKSDTWPLVPYHFYPRANVLTNTIMLAYRPSFNDPPSHFMDSQQVALWNYPHPIVKIWTLSAKFVTNIEYIDIDIDRNTIIFAAETFCHQIIFFKRIQVILIVNSYAAFNFYQPANWFSSQRAGWHECKSRNCYH